MPPSAEHPWTLADAALEYGRDLTKFWCELPQRLRDPEESEPDIFNEARVAQPVAGARALAASAPNTPTPPWGSPDLNVDCFGRVLGRKSEVVHQRRPVFYWQTSKDR